jgi:hypothetical protein
VTQSSAPALSATSSSAPATKATSADVARRERVARSIEVSAVPSGGFVLSIDSEAMLELMPVFEAERSYGNGPAWEALIEYLISSDPRLSELSLDSESDAALGFSKEREPLDALRATLLDAAADEQKLRKLIRAGRAAGFGHGDL